MTAAWPVRLYIPGAVSSLVLCLQTHAAAPFEQPCDARLRCRWQDQRTTARVHDQAERSALHRLAAARLLAWSQADVYLRRRIEREDRALADGQRQARDRALQDVYNLLAAIQMLQHHAHRWLSVWNIADRRDHRAKQQRYR